MNKTIGFSLAAALFAVPALAHVVVAPQLPFADRNPRMAPPGAAVFCRSFRSSFEIRPKAAINPRFNGGQR